MNRKKGFGQRPGNNLTEDDVYRRKSKLLARALAAADAMDRAAVEPVAPPSTERELAPSRHYVSAVFQCNRTVH